MTSETSTTTRDILSPVTLRSELECRVWWALSQASGLGIGEAELIKKTDGTQGFILKIMQPFIESGNIIARIQQVGTGGTCDHFYRLATPVQIQLIPKTLSK